MLQVQSLATLVGTQLTGTVLCEQILGLQRDRQVEPKYRTSHLSQRVSWATVSLNGHACTA